MTKLDLAEDAAKKSARILYESRYGDSKESPVDYTFSKFYNYYVEKFIPKMIKNIEYILTNQKEKSKWYGDIDWTIKIIENTKDRAVLYYIDHCTCGPHDKFLIVYNKEESLHVRVIYNSKIYKGKKTNTNYIDTPNFRFYKDRNFSFEYDKKYYNTPLQGVYGDARDNGFVLSVQIWMNKVEASPTSCQDLNMVLETLERTVNCLENEK